MSCSSRLSRTLLLVQIVFRLVLSLIASTTGHPFSRRASLDRFATVSFSHFSAAFFHCLLFLHPLLLFSVGIRFGHSRLVF